MKEREKEGNHRDVPSGQACGVFCPCGKAPGMASVSKWLPNPDWYCRGGRPETLSRPWEGAVAVVVPDEEEEEEDAMVMSIGLGAGRVKDRVVRQSSGTWTCRGWQTRGKARTCVSL